MSETISTSETVEPRDFSQHIAWNDSYLVCVAQLDADHQHLLRILNEACDACACGSHQRYHLILDELIAYTRAHFDTEEAYLSELEYPALADHRLEHRRFFDTIIGSRQTIGGRNVFYSIELVDLTETIYRWWHHHILEVDRRYREFAQGCP